MQLGVNVPVSLYLTGSIEYNLLLERMRAPVRHISYGIRHTALCRMYGIVAYARHNNHAGSPVLGIPALPH